MILFSGHKLKVCGTKKRYFQLEMVLYVIRVVSFLLSEGIVTSYQLRVPRSESLVHQVSFLYLVTGD